MALAVRKKDGRSWSKGIRTPHPCPYCGKQAKENWNDGRFKQYCATCGADECLKKATALRRKPVFTEKRTCEKCGERYQATGRSQRWCKDCVPDLRSRSLIQRYGLSKSEFQALIVRADGLCPICVKRKAHYVDHNHSTDEVRGVICARCNLMLGVMENEDLYERAKLYLEGKLLSV